MFVATDTKQELCEICLVRVAYSNMDLQAVFKRELFLAYVTHVALGSGVSRDVVEVVGPNRVALAASLALVPRQLLMYVSHVITQPTYPGERTLALLTDEPRARVFGPNVMPQPSLACKHGPTITTRMVVVVPVWIWIWIILDDVYVDFCRGTSASGFPVLLFTYIHFTRSWVGLKGRPCSQS